MNIQHLYYAVEVAKTGSISQAAESLYMGQPNLSKAIKELEETLGVTIFKRSTKGVVPTKDGEELLEYARDILSTIERVESHYRPARKDRQSFRISVPRSSYIAHAFTSFVAGLDMEKEMEIDFRETNSMKAIGNIEEEGFKLGIIRYASNTETHFLRYLEHRELKYQPIWEFEYLALMSIASKLANREKLAYRDLDTFIEIVHGDLSVPYLSQKSAGETAPEEDKIQKRIYIYERGSELDLLARIPSTYMWVSPMPKDVLERNDLVERPVKMDKQLYKDVLVYPAGYRFTRLDEAFIAELEKSKAEAAAYAEACCAKSI